MYHVENNDIVIITLLYAGIGEEWISLFSFLRFLSADFISESTAASCLCPVNREIVSRDPVYIFNRRRRERCLSLSLSLGLTDPARRI